MAPKEINKGIVLPKGFKVKKVIHSHATLKQKKAIGLLVAKGGSVRNAMRQAGYAEATVKNPDKLTKSKGFIAVLDAAGLTDSFLAQRHKELASAEELRDFTFPHTRKDVKIEIDEDDPAWDEEGRKRQFKMDTEKVMTPDKEILKVISSIAGCRLVYIKETYDAKIAYFTVPMHLARKAALELSYKVKGHNAPTQLDVGLNHELNEEEAKAISVIFSSNKKTP